MTDDEIAEKLKKIIPLGEKRKVNELARRLRVRRSQVEDAVQGCYVEGLDLIVGLRIGGGIYEYRPVDYEVEHYE